MSRRFSLMVKDGQDIFSVVNLKLTEVGFYKTQRPGIILTVNSRVQPPYHIKSSDLNSA